MAKTLRVIDPFFVMELGDVFEYDNDTKMYVSIHKEEFYKMKEDSVEGVNSSYRSQFSISEDYAKTLIEDGYLEEVDENGATEKFLNVFDEIDNLLEKYTKGLETIEQDCAELPACMKVERETVLSNLITILKHLKSLKK